LMEFLCIHQAWTSRQGMQAREGSRCGNVRSGHVRLQVKDTLGCSAYLVVAPVR